VGFIPPSDELAPVSEDTTSGPGGSGGDERPRDRGSNRTDDGTARYARVSRHPTPGARNSLWHWTEERSVARVVYNFLFVMVARLAPSLRVKNWALRRIGVTVGEGVSWALDATPDVFWPERITLEDGCIVGYDATILCHEFLQEEYRLGDVVVGERAMIGAGAVVLPGVHIGAGAQVAANSLVDDDVPAGMTVAGVPAEVVGETGEETGTVTD
jgi:acetyltransferase-like isoleucine patch superfamily enzyme